MGRIERGASSGAILEDNGHNQILYAGDIGRSRGQKLSWDTIQNIIEDGGNPDLSFVDWVNGLVYSFQQFPDIFVLSHSPHILRNTRHFTV
jgi:hypothetical protein